jgi:hypothetical protein
MEADEATTLPSVKESPNAIVLKLVLLSNKILVVN